MSHTISLLDTKPLSVATVARTREELEFLDGALAALDGWDARLVPYADAERLLGEVNERQLDLIVLTHEVRSEEAEGDEGSAADSEASDEEQEEHEDREEAVSAPEPEATRPSGLDVLRELRSSGYEGAILMLTESREPDLVRAFLRSGADGYVTRDNLEPMLFGSMIHVALARPHARTAA